jgi:hypothetical protein
VSRHQRAEQTTLQTRTQKVAFNAHLRVRYALVPTRINARDVRAASTCSQMATHALHNAHQATSLALQITVLNVEEIAIRVLVASRTVTLVSLARNST